MLINNTRCSSKIAYFCVKITTQGTFVFLQLSRKCLAVAVLLSAASGAMEKHRTATCNKIGVPAADSLRTGNSQTQLVGLTKCDSGLRAVTRNDITDTSKMSQPRRLVNRCTVAGVHKLEG